MKPGVACAKCAATTIRRPAAFYWRGEYRDAAYCAGCKAAWAIEGEEIPPLRQRVYVPGTPPEVRLGGPSGPYERGSPLLAGFVRRALRKAELRLGLPAGRLTSPQTLLSPSLHVKHYRNISLTARGRLLGVGLLLAVSALLMLGPWLLSH